jgi:AcrR family transcriptional regulator
MQNIDLQKVKQKLKFIQMTNKSRSTEDEIVHAAYTVFLFYGYHGTTLQQIASKANVNKSAIHYYYRSKEKLYKIVVGLMTDLILSTTFNYSSDRERLTEATWFLYTELYNNRILFEQTIKELYPKDWERKAKDLNTWLEFSNTPLSQNLRSSDWKLLSQHHDNKK